MSDLNAKIVRLRALDRQLKAAIDQFTAAVESLRGEHRWVQDLLRELVVAGEPENPRRHDD